MPHGISGGGSGAYVGSYLKRRGEALATKSDFKEVLEQTKKISTVQDEIRFSSDRQQRFLEKREELLLLTFELQFWLEQAWAEARRGTPPGLHVYPLAEMDTLADIGTSKADARRNQAFFRRTDAQRAYARSKYQRGF